MIDVRHIIDDPSHLIDKGPSAEWYFLWACVFVGIVLLGLILASKFGFTFPRSWRKRFKAVLPFLIPSILALILGWFIGSGWQWNPPKPAPVENKERGRIPR